MLVKHRASDLAAGRLEAVRQDGDQLTLERRGLAYVDTGTVTSAEITTDFPFDTLVPSWNVVAPAGTWIQCDLRALQGQAWTSWYVLGRWGSEQRGSVAGQKDDAGEVAVDTLRLARPAQTFQYRVTLTTNDRGKTPALRLVAVNYADLRRGLTGPKAQSAAGGARELPVPAQSQLLQDPGLAWDVCSPTSLTMVLQYWGVKRQVPDVIAGVRDATAKIYGNWPFNTAFAATQGLEAVVDRFSSIEQLQGEIAAGRPVVVSVRFKPGELDNAPVASTSGHLFVVRGFTAAGDVIVNDPLGASLAEVRRVYQRAQIANVWLGHGGIVYAIGPRVA